MINTPVLNFKLLKDRVRQADPSISVEKIHVEGNVTGNIVVGHGNVVGDHNVIYKVHSLFGAFINPHTSQPSVTRRPRGEAPHAPRRFVGRERELNLLEGFIHHREPVVLYSPNGLGKTTLLRKIANSEAAKSMPDGVIYLEQLYEGSVSSTQDLLQRLFDRLFESDPRIKFTDALGKAELVPTSPLNKALERAFPKLFGSLSTTTFDNSLIEGNLAKSNALLLLDEEGDEETRKRLPTLLPGGEVIATAQRAPFGDQYESMRLTPLSREEAIRLFVEKSGVAADANIQSDLDKVCKILEDTPLAIATVANGIRQNRIQLSGPEGLQLDALVLLLEEIQPPSQDRIQAAIERSFGFLYSQLSPEEREILADVATAPGKSVDRKWLETEWQGSDGEPGGAKDTVQRLEDSELLYANSPRMRMPEGLRGVLQSIVDARKWREDLLTYRLAEVEKRSLDFEYVAGELGNILGIMEWAFNQKRWTDVIRLGQAIDPYITLNGLWDAWETVLRQVEVAARNAQNLTARSWALHQLGTREIGVGTRERAIDLLKRALELRVHNGETTAAVYTLHNLRFLLPPGSNDPKDQGDGPNNGAGPKNPPFIKQLLTIGGKERLGKYVDIILAALVGAALIGAVLMQPWMRLSLEAKPGRYRPVGQVIEYSYLVDNWGLRELPGPIVVTSHDQAKVRCPDLYTIGDGDNVLDWNESVTCTSFYRVDEVDVDRGSIINTANAQAGESGVEASASLTIRRDDRYVMLEMQARPDTYKQTGDSITVAFLVSNPGTEALSGPVKVISKQLQADCSGLQQSSDGTVVLEAGGNFACTADYFINDTDVEAGSWTETVSVSIGDFASDEQTIRIPAIVPSPLTLTKSAVAETYQKAGQPIEYTYLVTNQGKNSLDGTVTVTDDKVQVICSEQDRLLNPGERITCRGVYAITEADISAGSVTNNAIASIGPIESEPVSFTIYWGRPIPTSVLNLVISADPPTYQQAEQEITYKYEVTNQGSYHVSGPVIVSDNLVKPVCPDVTTIGNNDSFLDPNEKLICEGHYRITPADMDRRSVTNTAWASTGGIHSAERTFTIYLDAPRPVLVKSAYPTTYERAGQEIRYIYMVTGPGATPLNGNVSVQDDKVTVECSQVILLANQNYAQVPNRSLRCTGTYITTEADVQNQSVTNTAWAVAGNSVSEPSSFTIYYQPPLTNLTLTKSAKPTRYESAGQRITYFYSVTNDGPSPLRGLVTVEDNKIKVNCPALDRVLDPGQSLICRGIYTITEADMESGSVTNTATAYVGDVESKPDSETIYSRGLDLEGVANPDKYEAAEELIAYLYQVTSKNKLPLPGPVTITITNDTIQAVCPPLTDIGNKDNFFDWKEILTCTGEYSTTQDDVDALPDLTANSVTNTAIAHAGNISSRPISLTISGPEPRLELNLVTTAIPTEYRTVGETITYNYVITNRSNMTVFPPFTITDDLTGNGQTFDCVTDKQRLAPGESATCVTKDYKVSQANFDFGNSKVTSNTSATGTFHDETITSSTVSTTIICPYPPNGYSYVARSGETLDIIASWFGGGTTKATLQQDNCMGTREENLVNITLYLPRQPPSASLSGDIRDPSGAPLWNTPVQLFNIRTGQILTVYTNGNGRYSFTQLDHDTYRIFQLTIPLVPGEIREQDFTIVPIQ